MTSVFWVSSSYNVSYCLNGFAPNSVIKPERRLLSLRTTFCFTTTASCSSVSLEFWLLICWNWSVFSSNDFSSFCSPKSPNPSSWALFSSKLPKPSASAVFLVSSKLPKPSGSVVFLVSSKLPKPSASEVFLVSSKAPKGSSFFYASSKEPKTSFFFSASSNSPKSPKPLSFYVSFLASSKSPKLPKPP